MTRAKRTDAAARYPLRFGAAAFLLITVTLVLVLFVLPQRYVLSTGFRESGMSFPTPRTPFVPVAVVPISAPPLPGPPPEILPGPAQLFWDEVLPLLRARDYAGALPVFEAYLGNYPGDRAVRRELALTLLATGRSEEAIRVLRALLAERSDPELRLLLARTLRDLGFTGEAAREYAILVNLRPSDESLALEWGQAHAWVGDYGAALAVLRPALARFPGSVPISLELARIHYALGNVREAARYLETVEDEELERLGAGGLWAAIRASFFVRPGVVPLAAPATHAERAALARVSRDFDEARRAFLEGLARNPADRALWIAYADLLEYELGDVEGAREALLEAERLGTYDPLLQLRLARHEIWTDRNPEARRRLERLLDELDAGVLGGPAVPRAEVVALLGDLYRWDGDRPAAAARYRLALAADPGNQTAQAGLAVLEEEVGRQIVQGEAPRRGGAANTLADTDDFYRVDAAGEWVEVSGPSVWRGSAGSRWLGGYALDGLEDTRSGVFFDVGAARWLRWGTVRVGLDVGLERTRDDWDVSFGGSMQHRRRSGGTSEIRYHQGLAYPLTGTLQSVLAELHLHRLMLTLAEPLGERWSAVGSIDGGLLRLTGAPASGVVDATVRLQGALSVVRALNASLGLGATASAAMLTKESPRVAGSGPLFWDPYAAFSIGPQLRLSHRIAPTWRLTGRLTPALALIDERRPAGIGYEVVPNASVEAGIHREGPRVWAGLDAFYSQGRLTGYRLYGARLTLSLRDAPPPSRGP